METRRLNWNSVWQEFANATLEDGDCALHFSLARTRPVVHQSSVYSRRRSLESVWP